MGSAAIQLARNVLELPVVIATASRQETMDYCKRMGATHVVNHRGDLFNQIKALELKVAIKYVASIKSWFIADHAVSLLLGTPTFWRELNSTLMQLPKSAHPLARFAQSCKPT